MTTFTTEDRIIAEKDGSLTVNVNAGQVTVTLKDLSNKEIDKLIEIAKEMLRKANEK